MNFRVLAALFAVGAMAQEATFRTSVALVRVDAEAVDASGRVVAGLSQNDFRVLDEGQPQPLAGFSFAEEPLDLILLFDMAGSMKGKIQGIVRAVELGFHELRKGDRVSVMVYNTRAQDVLGFTGDLEAVNNAILLRVLTQKFGGGSQVEKPAADAAERFRNEPATHRKRAVLAITDKPSGAAGPASDAAVQELWAQNAVMSELVIGSGPQTRLDSGVNALVDRTGGAVITAGVPGEAFQQSVNYLRSGYTLYYRLPEGSAENAARKVQTGLTEDAARRWPGVRIRARSGYLAPK